MTKFILHGGNTRHSNPLNEEFFSEIVKNLPQGAQVLLVYFARDEKEWPILYEQEKKAFKKTLGARKIKLVLASREHFMQKLKTSTALYMRGGDTVLLLQALKQYRDFSRVVREKVVVAGSSAGAYVLARYFFSSQNGVGEGLGILPIKIFCHYTGEKEVLDKLNELSADLELVLLRDYESKIITQ